MAFLKDYTTEEKSWMMYDWANSAHSVCVVTILPIFFQTVAAATQNNTSTMSIWGYATSIAMLIVAVAAPILGALGDFKGWRKTLLTIFTVIGATSCLLLAFSPMLDFSTPSAATRVVWFILVFYIISVIGFNASHLYYDAFLTDVTTEERADQVSVMGYGLGYIGGSTIPLTIFLIMNLMGVDLLVCLSFVFALSGVWWLFFSMPLLLHVEQRGGKRAQSKAVHGAVTGIFKTAKKIIANKQVFFYIVAYFFYIDGVHTIITMSTSYGANLGLDSTDMMIALLLVQVLGLPFCMLYVKLSKKYGPRIMVGVAIIIYTFICIFAFFMSEIWHFWLLCILVATSQGGIQALSRSMFSRLIPDKSQSGEYFGFFDVFGKFSAIIGPALCGFISAIMYTHFQEQDPSLTADMLNKMSAPYGILSIIALFFIGGAVYFFVLPKYLNKTIENKQQ